jgi:hypothetical protein
VHRLLCVTNSVVHVTYMPTSFICTTSQGLTFSTLHSRRFCMQTPAKQPAGQPLHAACPPAAEPTTGPHSPRCTQAYAFDEFELFGGP